MSYELKVGIETHFELLTESKLFCGCSTKFGASANTHCCPICLGLPGSLPVMNQKAINLAVRAGIATHCNVNNISFMDRKNYFYPDLAKGYQVTQYFTPICQNGYVNLENNKKIRIDQIHLEEDAGKLIYNNNDVFIDYNRSGVPLIEVVSMPDISSVEQAHEYVEKLIDLMRYIGISDCKMQEGSVRCDVNVSVKRRGSCAEGTRIEIKNINSVKFVTKAISYELNRQIAVIESGNKVVKETRKYNELTGTTESMRAKEDEFDYRYFREPDLVPLNVSADEIENIKQSMPEDFDKRFNRYTEDFNLPFKDAKILLKYKNVADYFDQASVGILNKKMVSGFILGVIFSTLNSQEEKRSFNVKLKSKDLNLLCSMVEEKKIDYSLAKKIIEEVLDNNDFTKAISQINCNFMNEVDLIELCRDVLSENQDAVKDFCGGKKQALQYLIGQVMRQSELYINATEVEDVLKEQIDLFYMNK